MGDLVGHHVDHPFDLVARRRGGVNEQSGLSEGDQTQVLHGPEGEVRDGDQVEFVAGIGDAEVVGEVAQRERGHLFGKGGEVGLAGGVDDANRRAVDVHRVSGLKGSDDEGHEVGRHHHRGCESDQAATFAGIFFRHHRAVRVGSEPIRDDERDHEGGLLSRLIEAGEGSARIGGLHLCGGDRAGGALWIYEGGAVEPDELIVEDAGEHQGHGGGPRRDRLRRGECHPLCGCVELDGALVGRALARDTGGSDLELDGIQDDGLHCGYHVDIDFHLTGEDGSIEVGLEGEAVGPGEDLLAEAVGVHDVGHAVRLPGDRVA